MQHRSAETEPRRHFLSRLPSWLMGGGLLAGYGTFAAYMLRFLFPSRGSDTSWQFVTDLGRVGVGESLTYTSPAGQRIVISRTDSQGTAGDFIALSSICPHLGCQVHWEGHNNRFFCPCHNGAFDPQGNPTEGPPKDAHQTLARYPLRVENNLLFIEVQTQTLV